MRVVLLPESIKSLGWNEGVLLWIGKESS